MSAPSTSPLPPGPRLPRWLQTLGFLLAPSRFLKASHRRYGGIVRFRTLFASRLVVVFDPELVRPLFAEASGALRAGEATALLRPAVRAVFGDRSVGVLDGAEHMRQRRLLLPPFHGERMRAHREVMREATDRVIDSWPVGERFELLTSMQELTLDVIMRAVFGIDAGARRQELARRVRRLLGPEGGSLQTAAVTFTRGRYGRGARARFQQHLRQVDELIYEEIARRRTSSELATRHDVLSMLLTARDEQGREMSDRELRDQLVTLLSAGHETTATALAWAFELLLRNPPALERLRAGLAAGHDEYLDAVVKETLRVRPIVARVGRVVGERPLELNGYRLDPGTEVSPSIEVIHGRPDLYPDPGSFRPERFLGADPPDTYTWIPFGGGTRRCLGASFATVEMAVVIRRVLERTRLVPAAVRGESGVHQGIFFRPRRGVRVVQPHPPRPATAGSGRRPPLVGATSG